MNRLPLFSHSRNAGYAFPINKVIGFKTAFLTAGFLTENNLITTCKSSANPIKTTMECLWPCTFAFPV